MLPRVGWRRGEQVKSVDTIEEPKHEQMREAVNVSQPLLVFPQ
jgi:hypothetical protein